MGLLGDASVGLPSANVVHNNATERQVSNEGTPYVKVKEIVIHTYITKYRVQWEQKAAPFQGIWSRVYLNGVEMGTVKSTTGDTYEAKSEDFVSNPLGYGDLLQLYAYVDVASGYVKEFEIAFDEYEDNDP